MRVFVERPAGQRRQASRHLGSQHGPRRRTSTSDSCQASFEGDVSSTRSGAAG